MKKHTFCCRQCGEVLAVSKAQDGHYARLRQHLIQDHGMQGILPPEHVRDQFVYQVPPQVAIRMLTYKEQQRAMRRFKIQGQLDYIKQGHGTLERKMTLRTLVHGLCDEDRQHFKEQLNEQLRRFNLFELD